MSGKIYKEFVSLFLSFLGVFAFIVILWTSYNTAKERNLLFENVIGLLHADSVENGDLAKIYATANLLGRADLIKKSSFQFQANLTASNVWIAHYLADTNEDLELKEAVEEYLLENGSKTIGNSTWREEVNRKIDFRKNKLRSLLK
ncbi:hypothetical protein TNIN_427041 [Trichonephila inaurata madagascariensis]|uniref:Uncharacterized protein n=2 Tax=Trichonephila inaurata madagascariensis TaxID=2747483 RepID=A0A8X7BZX2_9ARAC|nr:hypothetical protein TNIN_427041 [Trichonephila inaurata madagascariensis]